jgi:hypothetical protein
MRLSPRSKAISAPVSALSPVLGECAFCPFDVLSGRLAVLLNEIPQQCPKRLAPFVFRQYTGNVTRHRLGTRVILESYPSNGPYEVWGRHRTNSGGGFDV